MKKRDKDDTEQKNINNEEVKENCTSPVKKARVSKPTKSSNKNTGTITIKSINKLYRTFLLSYSDILIYHDILDIVNISIGKKIEAAITDEEFPNNLIKKINEAALKNKPKGVSLESLRAIIKNLSLIGELIPYTSTEVEDLLSIKKSLNAIIFGTDTK